MSILGAEKTKYLKNFSETFPTTKGKTHIHEKTVEEKRNTYLTLPSSQKNLEAITTTDMQRAGTNYYFTVQLPFIIFGS